MSPRSRTLAALAVSCAALAASAPAAAGATLDWLDCADGFQCASFDVPRDYAVPDGPTIGLAVIRLPAADPAHRIGSLFVNFGGPGGDAVSTVHDIGKDAFAALNQRFDIVGFDPRGVGFSSPAIDCQVDHENEGPVAEPFATPDTLNVAGLQAINDAYIQRCQRLNRGILPYVSTANVARDMDALREAVGDEKLSYLGFSYGTFLGATYATLFPEHYRALVLDGALDADAYLTKPTEISRAQTAAFEKALDRFLAACKADQDACAGFGGNNPRAAFDDLVASANADPIPAPRVDIRPVDGNDVLLATTQSMYAKPLWGILALGLARAEQGDGRILRVLTNFFIGRNPGEADEPGFDRFYAISALEGRFPTGVDQYLGAGERAFADFEHFWFNTGYTDLAWAQYPIEPRGAFFGPFEVPSDAPGVLVVGTTFDPATPYRGSQRLTRELAPAARLLTMSGDGHTAYPGNSPCIDEAVERYLFALTLPDAGTTCDQDVPFASPLLTSVRSLSARSGPLGRLLVRGPAG